MLFVTSTAFENRLAVAIVRVPGGLDYGCAVAEETPSNGLTATSSGSGELRACLTLPHAQMLHADSDLDISSTPKNNLASKSIISLLSTVMNFYVKNYNKYIKI